MTTHGLRLACVGCLSSAFGDRSYTWPYIGLILMPFIVATVIALALAWHAGWTRREVVHRLSAWTGRWLHRSPDPSPRTNTETT